MEAQVDKKKNAHGSNKAAAQDVQSTIDRVTDELNALFLHTGFSAWLLGSHNSVNDESPPTFFGSGDTVEFFPEVLSKDPWELTWLFEQWTCKQEKNLKKIDPLARVCAECAGYVKIELRNITNTKNIDMNYVNYERAIMLLHGVKIVDWPLETFISPSNVTNEWEKNGETVRKPRKKRSDAGITHGKRKWDDKENAGPLAKRSKGFQHGVKKKAAKVVKAVAKGKLKQSTSAEFIDSSDEEDWNEGDDEEDNSKDSSLARLLSTFRNV
ncbi:hypothetical protein PILCRDRAFT_90586 [Piloderma croceum F 1598]|uniref:Uncharacterized protein n=1 Tax=Piloderma croceum (strain F 1598) TaxID=765440 RepID=A0A0C3BM60_PILCF|nr:hypothetical protein PILCRDRAFT_90586 [Piloderma croceum F 1598]